MKFLDWWERLSIRLLAYVFFGLLFALGWRIVNAQSQTVCRPTGQAIVCTTVENPLQPQPGLDASVIGRIGETASDPQEIMWQRWLHDCVRRAAQEGLTANQIRDRCLK